jgi:hypothetical protein
VAKFFSNQDVPINDLMASITSGDIYDMDISYDNAYSFTMTGLVALMYVLNLLYQQIPQVSKMILSVFNVQESKTLGEQIGNSLQKVGTNIIDYGKRIAGAVISGGEVGASDDKKDSGDKKKVGDKKESGDKKDGK